MKNGMMKTHHLNRAKIRRMSKQREKKKRRRIAIKI
jgi:hypothetical protein